METVQQRLTNKGIRPSVQRMAIMDYLTKHHTHPTVDDIYDALHGDIPTLSKATVYNTLKLLVDKGAANCVNIDEKNARFDSIVDIHAHFMCKECGCIVDIPFEKVNEMIPKNIDVSIDETHLYFKGLCKKCKEKHHKLQTKNE